MDKIQLAYRNPYSSIWEYQRAFEREELDFSFVVAEACPICGGVSCVRRIAAYQRTVIELFPYRVDSISVVRFLCCNTGRTVSYLPFQLAPYFRYSVRSMVLALMLVCELREDNQLSLWGILEHLPADCQVTSFLLQTWLVAMVGALRRGHATLTRHYDLSAIGSCGGVTLAWGEVRAYWQVLWRGPPGKKRGIDRALRLYSEETRRHFLGTPSQERGGRV